MKKSINSKKVNRELGECLDRFSQALLNYCTLLEKLDQSFIPPPSLPTLQGIDSQLERQPFNLSDNTKEKRDDFIASSSSNPPNMGKSSSGIERSPIYLEDHFVVRDDDNMQQSFEQWNIPQTEQNQKDEGIQQLEQDGKFPTDSDQVCFSALALVLQCVQKILIRITNLLEIPCLFPKQSALIENLSKQKKKKKVKEPKLHQSSLQKKQNYHQFKSNLSKFSLCQDGLEGALRCSPNELFYLNYSHQDWQRLMKHYSFEDSKHPQPYRNFYKRITLANATMSKGMRGTSKFIQFFRTGAHLALYTFSQKKAFAQYEQFIADPNIEVARAVWNLPDSGIIKKFFKLMLPRVKLDQVIYIPKLYEVKLTIELMNSMLSKPQQNVAQEEKNLMEKMEQFKNDLIDSVTINQHPRYMSLANQNKGHYLENVIDNAYGNQLSVESQKHHLPMKLRHHFKINPKLFDPKHEVMIRIISNHTLPIDLKTGKPSKIRKNQLGHSILCCNTSAYGRNLKAFQQNHSANSSVIQPKYAASENDENPCNKTFDRSSTTSSHISKTLGRLNNTQNKLIIHIHGGGFISMSSFSHSTYLRKWANKTGVPIISIDYRLAPESKYPQGLDDCWQAYYWIINHAQEMIGISPKKIILVGDSAGGNFVIGVTLRAIQTGFKKPDGIILAYPALCLSLKTFNPSHLISLDDLLLPYSFLKICLQLYVGQQGQPDVDPYLSPLYIEDQYLKLFPTTRIMIAGKDPLRDDSFKFALRLLKLGVDVHVKEFRTFPHGFLSYDMPFGIKECKRGVEQGTKWIKQLFEIAEFDLKRELVESRKVSEDKQFEAESKEK